MPIRHLLMALFIPALPLSGSAVFAGIGHLSGQQNSGAIDVSADGSVVVGTVRSGTANRDGFFWDQANGYGTLLGGQYSQGRSANLSAISSDGTVVGGTSRVDPVDALQAFRWSSATGYQYVDMIAGSTTSFSTDLSGDGTTLVGFSNISDNTRRAWYWQNGVGTVALTDEIGSSFHGETRSVSHDGTRMVGVKYTSGGAARQAFLWSESTGYTDLGVGRPGDTSSQSQSISGNGLVVAGVTSSATSRAPFHWTEHTGMTVLLLPPGAYEGSITSITDDGTLLAGNSRFGYDDIRATLWDQNLNPILIETLLLAQGIDITAWTNTSVQGLSDDGSTIVGSGINPEGEHEGWFLTGFNIPEPSAISLSLSACLLLLFRQRP